MTSDIWLASVVAGEDLDHESAKFAMSHIMDGVASPEWIKSLILALKEKGETPTEVAGFVAAMMDRSPSVVISGISLDIVGTGGDQAGTVNISTTAAIVAAATGIKVVKHGNRAASSKSGSADVLEALGINLSADAQAVTNSVVTVGIGFCFAPNFHPAMKYAAPVRKELGIPTVFNILGPLANPAQPKAMVVGVANLDRAQLVAEVLSERGCVGFVVRGDDGLDEITTTSTTTIWQIAGSRVHKHTLDPGLLGINFASPSSLVGGDATHNARVLTDVLNPSLHDADLELIRTTVCLNAAAGIIAADKAQRKNFEDVTLSDWELALEKARAVIKSGEAANLLQAWQNF
jgi:anthranilate phosphoribosyltransferase